MAEIENSIGIVVDFYDKNGEVASDRYLAAFTYDEILQIERDCKTGNFGSFNRLQNDDLFDNIDMVPGLMYEPAENRWGLALNRSLNGYDPITATLHSDDTNRIVGKYDITAFIRNLISKNPSAPTKKQCYFVTADKESNGEIDKHNGKIVVITVLKGVSNNKELQDLKKFHDEQDRYVKEVLNQIAKEKSNYSYYR